MKKFQRECKNIDNDTLGNVRKLRNATKIWSVWMKFLN